MINKPPERAVFCILAYLGEVVDTSQHMNFSAVETYTDDEGEPGGPWRTAREFAQLLSDTSVEAGATTTFGQVGFSSNSIYQMGFVGRGMEQRRRDGTKFPEYPVHVQLDAAVYAIRYFARTQKAEVREKWASLAREAILEE